MTNHYFDGDLMVIHLDGPSFAAKRPIFCTPETPSQTPSLDARTRVQVASRSEETQHGDWSL